MEYKNNKKYFLQSSWQFYLSLALIGIGIILYIICDLKRIWELRQISLGLIIFGAMLFLIYIFTRPKDSEIEKEVKKSCEKVFDAATQKVLEFDKHAKILDSISIGYYDYENDNNKYFRKGRDGTLRSTQYTYAVIMYALGNVFVYKKDFSLIEDHSSYELSTFALNNIKNCEIKDEYFSLILKKRNVGSKYSSFNISSDQTVSIPFQEDSFSDEFCKKINDVMQKNQSI